MSVIIKRYKNLWTSWFLFRTLNVPYFFSSPIQFIAPLIAVACGVTLLQGILLFNSSVISSYEAEIQELHGSAQIEVIPRSAIFNQVELLKKIRAFPGVAEAAPILEGQALVEGRNARLQVLVLGADINLLKLAQSNPSRQKIRTGFPLFKRIITTRQLLSEVGNRPGDQLRLHSGTRTELLTITSTFSRNRGGKINNGRLLILPLDTAQALLGKPGIISYILVAGTDGEASAVLRLVRSLEAELGDHFQVMPLRSRLADLERSTEMVRAFSGFVAAVVMLVSSFLIYILFSMAVFRRRRELAILISIGEDPLRLRRRMVTEAIGIGLIGSGIGLIAGTLLGSFLVENSPGILEDAFTFKTRMFYPLSSYAIAVCCGIFASVIGAGLPTRGIIRLSPVDVFKDRAAYQTNPIRHRIRHLLFSVLFATVSLSAGVVFPTIGLPAFSMALLCILFCSPNIFTIIIDAVTHVYQQYPYRKGAGLMQIASVVLKQGRLRMVATISGATFSLAMVISIGATTDGIEKSVTHFAQAFKEFDLYATATQDPFIKVPLAVKTADSLLKIPGIKATHATFAKFIRWEGRKVWLLGEDAEITKRLQFKVNDGDLEKAAQALDGDGVIISTQIARTSQLSPGDKLSLMTPCGLNTFRVGAIVETWSWQEGTIVIGEQWFRRCFELDEPNQLKISLDPTANLAHVRQELQAAIPGVVIISGDELTREVMAHLKGQLRPFRLVQFAAITMVFFLSFNTNLMTVFQARREHGILRAIGVFKLEIAKALLLSAVTILYVAIPFGVILGLLMQYCGLNLISATTGLPLQWSFFFKPIISGIMAITVATLMGVLYPAWVSSRMEMDTLRSE